MINQRKKSLYKLIITVLINEQNLIDYILIDNMLMIISKLFLNENQFFGHIKRKYWIVMKF